MLVRLLANSKSYQLETTCIVTIVRMHLPSPSFPHYPPLSSPFPPLLYPPFSSLSLLPTCACVHTCLVWGLMEQALTQVNRQDCSSTRVAARVMWGKGTGTWRGPATRGSVGCSPLVRWKVGLAWRYFIKVLKGASPGDE